MVPLTEPRRVLVFGASGHLGGPVARAVQRDAPSVKLRLVTHRAEMVPALQQAYPNAEVVSADYYDLPSLLAAFIDVDRCFIVTPDFLDEDVAMGNVVAAVRHHRQLRHMVRLLADPPGMTLDRVPAVLRDFRRGPAVQHLRAKEILQDSRLPITYLNNSAYFMDDFITQFGKGLREHRTLAVPRNRRMGFLDTTDTAECVAAILLSRRPEHLGQTYHLDNGNDVMRFDEAAALMTDTLGVQISYDDSDERFRQEAGGAFRRLMGRDDAAEYMLEYFQFERGNETVWRKSDVVEFLTGRPAKTLRDWFQAHREELLG